MKQLIALVSLLLSASAFAGATTTKQIDSLHATGGTTITVPSTGANLITDSATQTLTNKSISGAEINSSVVGVGFGGTGLATLTTGNVILGAGGSTPTFVAPSTSGNVLTSNGSTWTSTAPSSPAPTLTGTQASPASVTAVGGLTLSTLAYSNQAFVVSNSGAVTVTATPSITACTAAGQELDIIGESASNVITLQDEASLTGTALHLNGNWTSGLNVMLSLKCDGNGFWIEKSRSN